VDYIPSVGWSGSDTEGALKCPKCKELYLHHGAVKIFTRNEDELSVIKTVVIDGLISSHRVPSDGSGNPSSRRDGIVIEFSCEHCSEEGGPSFKLNISQHKGYTLIGWEEDK
jgi:hypothetical protein